MSLNLHSEMSGNIFSTVTGHKPTIQRLLSLIEGNRIPHAFLFVGPKSEGKKKIALGFAQTLLCDKNKAGACGECPTCLGVAKGQSVGVINLEPEKGVIKIEAARALIRQLSLATWGKARVVIIDDAHLMNPQAANALLKSIEEPPAQTYFVLLSPSEESVLKTIRSRTQVLRFRGENAAKPDADVATAAFSILQNVARRDSMAAVSACREQLSSREQALQATQCWLTQVRDEWHDNTLGLSHEHLAEWSKLILGIERDLIGHCDLQLTLESGINDMAAVI